MKTATCSQSSRNLLGVCWLFCLLFVGAYLWLILPRKGFDFLDHGFYLYEAWSIAKGIIPPSGIGSVVDAGLLRFFGLRGYLLHEQVFVLVSVLAVIVFWRAFRKDFWRSLALPFTLIIVISHNYTNMLTYRTAPALFLLMGLAFFFYAIDTPASLRRILWFLASSSMLILSAFANTSLMPAPLIIWPCLYPFWRRQSQALYFHLSFFLLFLIFTAGFLLGVNSVFQHDRNFLRIFIRIYHLAVFWFKILTPVGLSVFAAFIFTLLLKKRNVIEEEQMRGLRPLILMLVGVVACLIFHHSNPLLGHLIRGVFFEYRENNLVNYSVLLFALFVTVSFTLMKNTEAHHRLLMTSLMSVAYAVGLSVTTYSGFNTHMAHLVPCFVVIMGLLYELYPREQSRPYRLIQNCFYGLLFLLAIFGIYLNSLYSFRAFPPFSSNKLAIRSGILKGIYAHPEKHKSLASMQTLYRRYRCANKKVFIAYPSLPLLYYLFKRQAPYHQQWLSPTVGRIKDPQVLVRLLSHAKSWCVFEAPGYNDAQPHYFSEVRDYLAEHADQKAHYRAKQQLSIRLGNRDYHFYYPANYTLYVK